MHVCDFCGIGSPKWCYHIPVGTEFGDPELDLEIKDDGVWYACNGCSELIESRHMGDLLDRCRNANPRIQALDNRDQMVLGLILGNVMTSLVGEREAIHG